MSDPASGVSVAAAPQLSVETVKDASAGAVGDATKTAPLAANLPPDKPSNRQAPHVSTDGSGYERNQNSALGLLTRQFLDMIQV